MYGDFSEESLKAYQEILGYTSNLSLEFGEGDVYDFTRCIRPNGTAYGTRGVCQAPNKVAPKQDVPQMHQKDFEAGGGLGAVRRGASSSQVVSRGRDARARAFESGGGMAAMSGRSGLSRDQVVQRGSQARAAAIRAGGGARAGATPRELDQIAERGARARAAAFKAGGGEASLRGGANREDIIRRGAASLRAAYEAGGGRTKFNNTPEGYGNTDVIAQGRRNLKAAFEAGGGEAARANGMSVKDIIAKGKRNLRAAFEAGGGEAARGKLRDTNEVIARGKRARDEAARAGGGNVERGRQSLNNPIRGTRRNLSEAGGGVAEITRLSGMRSKQLGRALTDKERTEIAQSVADRGALNLNRYFRDGGGRKALASGKSVDDIINIGERIAKDKQRKAQEARARNLRNQIDRSSQVV